jgi:hypothetical protein
LCGYRVKVLEGGSGGEAGQAQRTKLKAQKKFQPQEPDRGSPEPQRVQSFVAAAGLETRAPQSKSPRWKQTWSFRHSLELEL